MSRIIGPARDFYRLRLTRYDASDEPDFEWRDDVLYRNPPATTIEEREEWAVEALTLDDAETVSELARFADSNEAHGFLDAAEEDLQELTKSSFEEKYLIGT